MLEALFTYAGQSPLGLWMRGSRYAFPAFETAHLTGLAVLLGAVLLINARFFELGLRRQRLAEVAGDLAPWTGHALLVMVLSGVPLFCSKAPDLWEMDRDAFLLKMGLVAAGVGWHYGVQLPLARQERLGAGRAAAVVSLMLWFGAAVAGLSLEFL